MAEFLQDIFRTRRAYFYVQSNSNVLETGGDTGFDVEEIRMEATSDYSVVSSAAIAKHPVASGSDIGDHLHVFSDKINMSGVISDTPTLFTFAGTNITAEEYNSRLNDIKENKRLVTVVLPSLGTFNNCALISGTVTKDAKTGNGLRISLSFDRFLLGTAFSSNNVAEGQVDKVKDIDNSGNTGTTDPRIDPRGLVNAILGVVG